MMDGLSATESVDLLHGYFKRYRKQLNDSQAARVAGSTVYGGACLSVVRPTQRKPMIEAHTFA